VRLVAPFPPDMRKRTSFVRAMLVTNPQQKWGFPGQGVLFAFHSEEDGPHSCNWPFKDLDEGKEAAQYNFEIATSEWYEIPDQMPGCLDDWIAPVRIVRESEEAEPRWERFDGSGWIVFNGPSVPRRRPGK
jgi:hypothetical protein